MIKSMTGYGRGEKSFGQRIITVEIRAVNNRYLDCSVRIPRIYLCVEEQIKSVVQHEISRGKVDVFVSIEGNEGTMTEISVNRPVAEGYHRAYAQLAELFQMENDLTTSMLAKLPEVLLVEKAQEDLEQVGGQVLSVLQTALEDFDKMRQREGEKLHEDLLFRRDTVEQLLSKIEARSPGTVSEYQQKLKRRMSEVLEQVPIDEGRILAEAAIFADKIAVSEETVRLRSHLAQMEEMLSAEKIVGRKLDFLIQEFNREANTIGSKCNDLEISRWVVDMKAEIEKIREQVQNIE